MPSSSRPARISSETAAARAWGTFLPTAFGTAWLLAGLHRMHHLSPHHAYGVACLGIAALVVAVALLQAAKRLPSAPLPLLEQARVRRISTAVHIIQWVAVATAVVVLMLLRLPEYIVPAVGMLVGLHQYPLASAYRNPLQTVTGTVLVAWCAVCIALLPKSRLPGLGVFGTGAILLLSSISTLLVASARTRAGARLPLAADLITR